MSSISVQFVLAVVVVVASVSVSFARQRARRQHEMCQSRHSVLGWGNASKVAPLGQPRITVPNLFIPVAFAGYPWIPLTVREFKRREEGEARRVRPSS